MKLLLLAALLVLPLPGDSASARYEAAREEAKRALLAGDLATAETKYSALLQLAEQNATGSYEIYANVVTPLADVYRRLDRPDKLEALYTHRVEVAKGKGEALDLGLAQADLGFFYQNSDVSADRFHGERHVEQAMRTFEQCAAAKPVSAEQCRRRLADTAGIQGAIYFQQLDYKRAEPLFRRVVNQPEEMVQAEVLFVALHALRGILVQRNQQHEAQVLERRAAEIESRNGAAVARLRNQTRSRTAN